MNQDAQGVDERQKVGMLLPPPILLLALAAGCALLHVLWLGWSIPSAARAFVGGGIVIASVLLVASCGRLFRRAGTPVRPVAPTTTIVMQGAYRFSRNPMYVGMAGVLVGLAVLAGSVAFALAALLFVAIVHHGVVLPEERYLTQLHGADYLAYSRQVRRWL